MALTQIVEVHALRRAGDPNAAPFALPSSGSILRRGFAGFVAIREHDQVANVARQIERPQARGRKRCPGGISGRLHRCKAGLNPFADHQHVARLGQTHHAATTRPEHHLRGIDRCFAVAVAGEKGAVNGDPVPPRVTSATIAGQSPPEGCFKPAWKRRAGEAGRSSPREHR